MRFVAFTWILVVVMVAGAVLGGGTPCTYDILLFGSNDSHEETFLREHVAKSFQDGQPAVARCFHDALVRFKLSGLASFYECSLIDGDLARYLGQQFDSSGIGMWLVPPDSADQVLSYYTAVGQCGALQVLKNDALAYPFNSSDTPSVETAYKAKHGQFSDNLSKQEREDWPHYSDLYNTEQKVRGGDTLAVYEYFWQEFKLGDYRLPRNWDMTIGRGLYVLDIHQSLRIPTTPFAQKYFHKIPGIAAAMTNTYKGWRFLRFDGSRMLHAIRVQ